MFRGGSKSSSNFPNLNFNTPLKVETGISNPTSKNTSFEMDQLNMEMSELEEKIKQIKRQIKQMKKRELKRLHK